MNILNVYYDLRITPLSFDFVNFLAIACAEGDRRDARLSVTLYYPFFRNSNPIEASQAGEYQHWKLMNVHVHACHLCPRVVEVITNRSPRIRFDSPRHPADYDPRTVNLASGLTPVPITHHHLDAAMAEIKDRVIFKSTSYADDWFKRKFGEKPVVVMSTRTTPHNAQRNTPLEVWYAAYRRIVAAGYTCVIVPDQDDYLSGKNYHTYDWPVMEEACMSIDLRLALYRNAFATIAWSGGAEGLLALSGATFTIYGIWNEGNTVANRNFFERKGPRFGLQPPWFDPLRQRYDWHPAAEVTEDYIVNSALTWLQRLKDQTPA